MALLAKSGSHEIDCSSTTKRGRVTSTCNRPARSASISSKIQNNFGAVLVSKEFWIWRVSHGRRETDWSAGTAAERQVVVQTAPRWRHHVAIVHLVGQGVGRWRRRSCVIVNRRTARAGLLFLHHPAPLGPGVLEPNLSKIEQKFNFNSFSTKLRRLLRIKSPRWDLDWNMATV